MIHLRAAFGAAQIFGSTGLRRSCSDAHKCHPASAYRRLQAGEGFCLQSLIQIARIINPSMISFPIITLR